MISDTPDRAASEGAAVSTVVDVEAARQASQSPEGSEEFARATVDALSSHIAILDEHGLILHTNQAWRSFAVANGMSDSAFAVGRDYLAICDAAEGTDAAEAKAAAAGIRSVLQGVNRQFTMEYVCHAPREDRWFVMRVTRIEGSGPLRVVMAHEDITERRLAEEAIQASEARLREQFEEFSEFYKYTPVAMFVLDRELRYVRANERLAETSGRPLETMLGHSLYEILPADMVERLKSIWRPVFEEGRPVLDVEMHGQTLQRPGVDRTWLSSYFPLKSATGEVVALAGAILEITQRKLAEDALRESEHRFKALAAATFEGIVISEEGRITDVNDQLLRMLGYRREEFVGAEVAAMIPPEHRELALSNIREGRESHIEHRLIRQDGTPLDVEAHGSTVHYQNRKVRFTAIRDVTARKRAEDELRAASKAKDHFLAVLSHELRNPLNPVLATASMLRADPRFDADTREQLEVICRNAELEARLIDDLLDVTRIERGKIELDRRPVELGTIIRRAAEVCMPDIEARKMQFSIDLGQAACWVDADAGRLQQVFWNLIKNAAKFTPVGGHVSIRCRPDREGGVVVEVQDSGEGIEAEALGRIFNAFEQGERTIARQFGGLGLGLTISKAMVEMHGGTIEARSDGKGKGATFIVRLPVLPAGVVPTTVPTSDAPAAAASWPLRILVVEDHGDTARIMQRILSADGHKVETAADVATALKLAGKQTFDLLLSDLGLPDASGLDLMRALRKRGLELPGIALSGYGQEQDVQQSREVGFVEHLVKPVSIPRLEDAIARIFEGGTRVAGGG